MDEISTETMAEKADGQEVSLADLPELMVVPDFVSLVGSLARHGKGEDCDILFRTSEADDSMRLLVERAIAKDTGGEIHAVWNAAGPHGTYLPLYDLVLRPKTKLRRKILDGADTPYRFSSPTEAKDRKATVSFDEGVGGRFVLQSHARGKSLHHDLRMSVDRPEKRDYLQGLTLFTPGAVGQPNKLFEADAKTEFVFKPDQPMGWLTFEGETKPGDVGATVNEPGVFKIVDKGTWEAGVQEPHFKEFKFNGNRIKGRWVASAVPGLPGREGMRVWLFSKPADQAMRSEAKRGEKAMTFAAFKSADELQTVWGVVMLPNVPDTQGQMFPPDAIRRAMHKFNARWLGKKGQVIRLQHGGKVDAEIVESYQTPSEVKYNGTTVPEGAWVMAVKLWDTKTWAAVKAGDLTGLSPKIVWDRRNEVMVVA